MYLTVVENSILDTGYTAGSSPGFKKMPVKNSNHTIDARSGLATQLLKILMKNYIW